MKPDLSYEINDHTPEEKKRFVRGMFDSIVPTYDFLNRLLSAGIDRSWRRSIIELAGELKDKKVLDLCCGTGDLSRLLDRAGADLVSLDFSLPMLRRGRKKRWLRGGIVAGDAGNLPFRADTFAYLTIAFGIRNIPDINNFIRESLRVLEPGGGLYILELTRPGGGFRSFMYRLYLRRILPFVGGIVSGRMTAYRYLSETISTFLDPDQLSDLLLDKGFFAVRMYRKTSGLATIFECIKPDV